MQFVCAGFGDYGHLANGTDVGAVVGHIDANFFKTFDELNQRSYLRTVLACADADAIDGLIGLIATASRKSPERFAATCGDNAWR